MKNIVLITLLILIQSCGSISKKNVVSNNTIVSAGNPQTVYDYTMKNIDGVEVPLSAFKGKVMVIINTASKCGHTPQYEGIETFYKKYKDKGVEVLGFPANNFLGQEPGSDAEIKNFCTLTYNVTFPMFSKISVKGDDIHPLYQYLTEKKQNGAIDAPVMWNFQKFVVNKKGQVVASFAPANTVENKEFLSLIEELCK